MVMATHVVVGRSENLADKVIAELARVGDESGWTVPRVARSGDRVLFYLLNPEGSFVAAGVLLSDAVPGVSDQGDGAYVADVGQVAMLPRAVPRLEVVEKVPGWGWPRQPHTATTVPREHVPALMGALS
jgi:hypothetical protein